MTDNDEEILNHALQTFVENLTNSIKKGLVLVEGKIATGSVDMSAYTCTVNIETNTLAFINIAPDNKPQTDKSTKLDAGHISFSNVPLETLINSQASFVVIPNDVSGSESNVLMTFRDGNIARPQLIKTHKAKEIIMIVVDNTDSSKVDITPKTIIFNGGSNGLPLSDKLTTKLNNLEKQVNNLQEYFNTHIHTSAAAGSPTSPTTTQDTDSPLIQTVQSDIASTKIKQQ